MTKPTIEEIGMAAANWWRLEKDWQRKSANRGHYSRDLVGKAYQSLVDVLNAYVGDPPQTINDEDGS